MISKQIDLRTPEHWSEYELIDSGNFEKLERFGTQVLIRPEPQAVWDKSLSEAEWKKMANISFRREASNPEKGEWKFNGKPVHNWIIKYPLRNHHLTFELQLTSFKHVGLFPEQADNWEYIYDEVQKRDQPKVLNLFAYTGGASLAACAAGADVVHLDAVHKVVTWSRENMEKSNLDGIRWLVEDAFSFVQREVRRDKKYDGIILDPPAYGRGPKGEKWVLEEQINALMKNIGTLLNPGGFIVMNLYSMGLSALVADNLLRTHLGVEATLVENYLEDRFGKRLPLGTVARGIKS